MFQWIHHLLNPHCLECLAQREAEKICKSCEILQYEVERLRSENERLLSRILEKPEVTIERTVAPEPIAAPPRRVPWAIRRQMLEAEDREKARVMANAPQPQSTEELEKELDIATAAREGKSSNSTKS